MKVGVSAGTAILAATICLSTQFTYKHMTERMRLNCYVYRRVVYRTSYIKSFEYK